MPMTVKRLAKIAALLVCMSSAADATSLDEGFDRAPDPIFPDLVRQAKLDYGRKAYDDSFRNFQRAACAGDKESQFSLGKMYLLGQGTTRNDYEGYAWLKTAAEYRFRGYQSTVEKMRAAMTPDQLKVADDRAALLTSEYGLRATNISCNDSASRGGLIQDSIVCTPRHEGHSALLKRCMDAPSK